jgi:FolB domain-containing protein
MPTPHKFANDRVFIESLRLKCTCGPDAFGQAKVQPVRLSVDLGTTVARAAASDRVDLSVDYYALSDELTSLENTSFKSPMQLMDEVVKLVLAKEGVGDVSIVVQLEKGALMAKQVKWERVATIDERGKGQSKLGVKGIEVPVVIGIEENTFERTQKQLVRLDLIWEVFDDTSKPCPNFDIHDAVESIIQASIFH